jgi:hypothetical protein
MKTTISFKKALAMVLVAGPIYLSLSLSGCNELLDVVSPFEPLFPCQHEVSIEGPSVISFDPCAPAPVVKYSLFIDGTESVVTDALIWSLAAGSTGLVITSDQNDSPLTVTATGSGTARIILKGPADPRFGCPPDEGTETERTYASKIVTIEQEIFFCN